MSPPGFPKRRCNGGPHGKGWCGKPATVVCTDHPLQWYACDDPQHREGAHVQPVADWFASIFGAEPIL